MTIKVGDRIPSATLIKADRRRAAAGRDRRLFRRPQDRPVRRPRRVHADLLGAPSARLCRARRRAEGQGRRRDRLRRGQRRLRACRPGPRNRAPRARSPCSPTAMAISPTRSASSADFSKFGMGKRGQRWSAIVDDGVVSGAECRGAGRVQRVERGVPLGAALSRAIRRLARIAATREATVRVAADRLSPVRPDGAGAGAGARSTSVTKRSTWPAKTSRFTARLPRMKP